MGKSKNTEGTISEKDFDKMVSHTLRLDMTDGTALTYSLSVKEKQFLIDRLRERSEGSDEKGASKGWIMFEAYPDRVVFINTAYMLRLIFCFDMPAGATDKIYQDNFNALDDHEKTKDNLAIIPDADDDLVLPQVNIKLSGKVDYPGSDILTFSSLQGGELSWLDMEIADPDEGLREFISLIDDDGEDNFIPLRNIMCIEADKKIVFGDE